MLSGDAGPQLDASSQAEAGSAPLPTCSMPAAEACQHKTPEITVLEDLDAIAAHRKSHLSGNFFQPGSSIVLSTCRGPVRSLDELLCHQVSVMQLASVDCGQAHLASPDCGAVLPESCTTFLAMMSSSSFCSGTDNLRDVRSLLCCKSCMLPIPYIMSC